MDGSMHYWYLCYWYNIWCTCTWTSLIRQICVSEFWPSEDSFPLGTLWSLHPGHAEESCWTRAHASWQLLLVESSSKYIRNKDNNIWRSWLYIYNILTIFGYLCWGWKSLLSCHHRTHRINNWIHGIWTNTFKSLYRS